MTKRKYDVAVMHDYFVDRLVHVGSPARLGKLVGAKASEGGGGIHGISQEEIRGGNAVNLAHAAASLGLRVLLITHSTEASEHLLRSSFEGLDAEVRVKPLRAGLTVAFEGRVNVMLGDNGGAGDFGPERLDDGDWDALEGARVVCSVNWAANSKGTALLRSLRRRLGPAKKIFIDPADFRDRIAEFGEFLRLVSRDRLADWVSMNQEEAKAAAGALGIARGGLAERCKMLARELGVEFDLHGMRSSYRSDGATVVGAAAGRVRPRRLTGAGDVWDAGSIYGRLKGWEVGTTLRFANAAAKLYLEASAPVPPTLSQVHREAGWPTSPAS